MITLILVLCSLLAIIVFMKNSPPGFEESGLSPFAKPAMAKESEAAFRKFCTGECKYRYVCLCKSAAARKQTCLEHELNSHRLW